MAFAALIAGLAGCGTTPANPTQLATIHSVYIKPDKEPQVKAFVGYIDWTPTGTDVTLNSVVTAHGLRLSAEMHDTLESAFRADGYEVRESADGVDAVIDYDVDVAMYMQNAPIFGGGCSPLALIDIAMKDAKSGATIFSHTYRLQSGGGTGITGHILLPSDPKYDVSDCATLWSDPQLPVDAFRSALPQVARNVGVEVAKPGAAITP
jgi:hypothetical protein